MQLKAPLTKLPIRFDADLLAAEVAALPASAWVPHPSGYVGNEAVRLVTPNGEETDDLFGPMAPTEHLLRSPYMMDAMAEIGAAWGRSRLMGLAPGSDVPPHIDVNYYWRTHIRVHIPVITNPGVEFTCGEQTVHMRAGECWVLDTFRNHTVANRGADRRIHLVIDTVGGQRLWDLIRAGEAGAQPDGDLVPASNDARRDLYFERENMPRIMSPWELKCHIADLLGQTKAGPRLDEVGACLERFVSGWAALWVRRRRRSLFRADRQRPHRSCGGRRRPSRPDERASALLRAGRHSVRRRHRPPRNPAPPRRVQPPGGRGARDRVKIGPALSFAWADRAGRRDIKQRRAGPCSIAK